MQIRKIRLQGWADTMRQKKKDVTSDNIKERREERKKTDGQTSAKRKKSVLFP